MLTEPGPRWTDRGFDQLNRVGTTNSHTLALLLEPGRS